MWSSCPLDLGTFSLVTWSLHEMCSILRQHFISIVCILLWNSAVRVHGSQAYRKKDMTREPITRISIKVTYWPPSDTLLILLAIGLSPMIRSVATGTQQSCPMKSRIVCEFLPCRMAESNSASGPGQWSSLYSVIVSTRSVFNSASGPGQWSSLYSVIVSTRTVSNSVSGPGQWSCLYSVIVSTRTVSNSVSGPGQWSSLYSVIVSTRTVFNSASGPGQWSSLYSVIVCTRTVDTMKCPIV